MPRTPIGAGPRSQVPPVPLPGAMPRPGGGGDGDVADRGSGWYYAAFPPGDVEFFDISYMADQIGPVFFAGLTFVMPAVGTNPFGSPAGMVYLITDWQFHAWETTPGGRVEPLARNALAPDVSFVMEIDGVPARTQTRMVNYPGAPAGNPYHGSYPYLESRPGPQLQSSGFPVAIPVADTQIVAGRVVVHRTPAGIVVDRIMMQFSGLKMARSRYEAIMRGV